MTIYEYYLVVGVAMPDWKVYQDVFRNNSFFREDVEEHTDQSDFTWAQFEEYILGLNQEKVDALIERIENRGPGEESIDLDMWDSMRDSLVCYLGEFLWYDKPMESEASGRDAYDEDEEKEISLSANGGVRVFPVHHDIDKDEPYVVGIKIATIEANAQRGSAGLAEVDKFCIRLERAQILLRSVGLNEPRLFLLQNDCGCCT
jgi:hypothetical protein